MKNRIWKKTLLSFLAVGVLGSSIGMGTCIMRQTVSAAQTEAVSPVTVTKEYQFSKNIKGTKPNGKKVKILEFKARFPQTVSVDGNAAAEEKITKRFSDQILEIKKTYKEYKKEAKDYFKEAPENMGKNQGFYSLSYDYNEETRGEMYSALSSMTCYMMGAHGGFIQTGYNFDLRTGEEVFLHQLLPFKTDAKFRKKLVTYIKKQVTEEKGEDVLYEEINWDEYFGENPVYKVEFTLIDGKITLMFNQYEIAPYAAGTIYIELDHTMEKYLTGYGKELLGNE